MPYPMPPSPSQACEVLVGTGEGVVELELHMAASPAVFCKAGRGFLAHGSQAGPCSQHAALGAGTHGRDVLILCPPSSALRGSLHPSFPPRAGPGTFAPGISPSIFLLPCPNGELRCRLQLSRSENNLSLQ